MNPSDIRDAINERLVARWPERTVYIDVCPVDFERPSFWLAASSYQQNDANRLSVRKDLTMQLTLYDRKDDHYETSWDRLQEETNEVLSLLSPVLTIGSRRLLLTLKALPREPDRQIIQLHAVWMDARPGLSRDTITPLMETFDVAIDGKKG